MCNNINRLLKLLGYLNDPTLKFYPFSQCQNLPQEIRLTLGNLSSATGKLRNSFLKVFLRKSSIEQRKISSRKTTFLQPEISYENEWYRSTR